MFGEGPGSVGKVRDGESSLIWGWDGECGQLIDVSIPWSLVLESTIPSFPERSVERRRML